MAPISEKLTIAVDAMGGDDGPAVIIPGLNVTLLRHPDLELLIYGDRNIVSPLIEKYPALKKSVQLIHTDIAVSMDDKPSQALRKGRRTSSMWLAIQAVKTGQAQAAVSAGNTGALMAMAKVILKTIGHVNRPAIAAIWPTMRGDSIVLDLGATIGPDAEQLVHFAVMGRAMYRAIYSIPEPSIGLLNVGQEEIKGLDEIKQAAQWLRSSPLALNYFGFVEGDDIGKGTVDVVVTEGFSGNIALKTAEGTAHQIIYYLKVALGRSLSARLGYLLAKSAFDALRDKLDPRNVNGGVFLGLNGIVVKSHGGTDARGFASAMDLAIDMGREDLVTKISSDLDAYYAAGRSVDILDPEGLEEKKVSVS